MKTSPDILSAQLPPHLPLGLQDKIQDTQLNLNFIKNNNNNVLVEVHTMKYLGHTYTYQGIDISLPDLAGKIHQKCECPKYCMGHADT